MLSTSFPRQNIKCFETFHIHLNIPQYISFKYDFTDMEYDQSPPEERPNVKKMLIRCVFTQGSNSKSLPLKTLIIGLHSMTLTKQIIIKLVSSKMLLISICAKGAWC